MKVLIYRTNEDQAFADHCRIKAEKAYPTAKIQERNAEFFDIREQESADVVYVRSRYEDVIAAYGDAVVDGVDTQLTDGNSLQKAAGAEESPFSGEYEDEVMRLLNMSFRQLEGALSRVGDIGILYLARGREHEENGGRGRVSNIRAYNKAIRALGGE